MLFPTTLVGSYPQPEWLIDRKIPAWDRLGLVIVADAEAVHAVLGLPAISPPPPDDDALYLRATRT